MSNDPTGNNPGGPAFDGTQAYFDYINASKDKGVCGRKLVLSSKRDDSLANNRQEVQGLLDDNVFAALPMTTSLFTGADLLVSNGIPTFGWLINGEWGSEDVNPGPPNLFGQNGSFLNLKSPGPNYYADAWLAQKLNKKRVGLIAYNVPQSSGSADAIDATFQKFPKAGKVVFKDTSLSFGAVDYSVQVSKMKDEKVNLVIPSVDANGAFTLAREMKKQGLNAPMILPNAYNQERIAKNADVAEGSYVFTLFTPFESKSKPAGLKLYEKWIKKSGGAKNENSVIRVAERRSVRQRPEGRGMRLHAPEGHRRRQPDDGLHRRWTHRPRRLDEGPPDGSQLRRVGEGRERQVQARLRAVRQAVLVLPGGSHVDSRQPRGRRVSEGVARHVTQDLPKLREAAHAEPAEHLEHEVGNL